MRAFFIAFLVMLGSILVAEEKDVCAEFCTRTFTLNAAAATCVLETFDQRLDRLERSGQPLVRVDISEHCLSPGQKAGNRDPVGKIPDVADLSELYLSREWLICLGDHIMLVGADAFDPETQVNLDEICK